MAFTFPNESDDYRSARNALLDAEIALKDQIEAVAEQRRALPPGGKIKQNYVFTTPSSDAVPLDDLFGDHDTLALYSYMLAPGNEKLCPGCTSLMDGWNGQAKQIKQRISFAIVSSATPDQLGKLKADRGWSNVDLYSAQGTSYQADYGGTDTQGRERTIMNVFHRQDGVITHFWGSELERADVPGHPRHLDIVWPLWGMLDFTPDGRGDFFPKV